MQIVNTDHTYNSANMRKQRQHTSSNPTVPRLGVEGASCDFAAEESNFRFLGFEPKAVYNMDVVKCN